MSANNPVTFHELVKAGFQSGMFLPDGKPLMIKYMRADAMPHVREHIVGTLDVIDSDTVCIEAQVGGNLVMRIGVADHQEGPFPIDSDEGKRILIDAGVKFEQPQSTKGAKP